MYGNSLFVLPRVHLVGVYAVAYGDSCRGRVRPEAPIFGVRQLDLFRLLHILTASFFHKMYTIKVDGVGLRYCALLSNLLNSWPLREARDAAAYERARHDDAHNYGSSTTCCRHDNAKDISIIRCAARATAELVASYCCTYTNLTTPRPGAC